MKTTPILAALRACLCSALVCSGCASLFGDDRPWVVNSTRKMLEVRTTHADGHTLKIMLYPGMRVPLGAAEEPVREIAFRRPQEAEMVVSESDIKSCLADRNRSCQGWQVSDSGLETLDKRGSASAAAEPAAGTASSVSRASEPAVDPTAAQYTSPSPEPVTAPDSASEPSAAAAPEPHALPDPATANARPAPAAPSAEFETWTSQQP